jgi:phosphatidate phosphatase PAH1
MKLGEAGEAFFEEEITKSVGYEEQIIIPEAESPQLVKEQNIKADKLESNVVS